MSCQTAAYKPGLVGIYFSEPNLTSVKAVTVLDSLDQNWDESVDFQAGSSGIWDGFIISPFAEDVNFHLQTNKIVMVEIEQSYKIRAEKGSAMLTVPMEKGRAYPVRVTFWNAGARTDYGYFNIKWSWADQELSSISPDFLKHAQSNLDDLSWLPDLDPRAEDLRQFLTVAGKHVIVYHEPGRFGAWPANNGIWNWGDEILVGFMQAYYKENKYHHSVNYAKPMRRKLARSLDGGETWTVEDPDNFVNDGVKPVELKEPVNFAHPDLAMRFIGSGFFVSYTRGKTWNGPFRWPDFGLGDITTRTDYLVSGPKECFFFLSAKDQRVIATLQDRAFCARSTDGGRTIEFMSWMAETDTIRSVMPATVRISDTHLITAMRRRYDPPLESKKTLPKNYITVHESRDNGKNWTYLSTVAQTDKGIRNGNPPSMVRLNDGRLCVTYGYRNIPYSIRARISSDNGQTWSKEILLRDDGRKFDIGYTRSVVRADGKIATVYYFTTEQIKEMHIAATIWDADDVKED